METFKIFLKPLKTEMEVLGVMFELDLICTFVMAGFSEDFKNHRN